MSFLSLTNDGAQRIMENFLGVNDAFGTGAWLGLFTVSPNTSGTGWTEATGYSRGLLSTWNYNLVDGTISALLDASEGVTSAPAATITAWGLFDTQTGGTLLAYCILDVPVTLAAGDSYLFPVDGFGISVTY